MRPVRYLAQHCDVQGDEAAGGVQGHPPQARRQARPVPMRRLTTHSRSRLPELPINVGTPRPLDGQPAVGHYVPTECPYRPDGRPKRDQSSPSAGRVRGRRNCSV